MNEAQAYALAHPVGDPALLLGDRRLWRERKHPRGFLLRSALAVDR